MCCLIFTRRGLAYFGVLVQLLVGLLVIPLITLTASYSIGPSSDGSGRFLSASDIIFVFLYAAGMCILAGMIFKGIRTESIKLLYLSIASLILFQLGAGVTMILLWKLEDNDRKENILRFTCLGVNVFSTLSYLIILIVYTRYLRRKLCTSVDEDGCEDQDSEYYTNF